ncbi:dynactin subunit 3 isoform X1 [Sus scrofa]|uniref:dynactin subunit 3 isoform X1 n=1 Tax=Sus scrofa TaxID=9823 RepID=UPI0003AEE0F5|nr:dynactin subunit 3 isoform X1 [Sus scrofa]
MAGVTDVQRLQARLEELERWVYGPGGSRGSRKVADGLVKVQVALGNIASKRERVKILYKKIEDLIKYLDPEYMDRIAIPDASKLQFILAEEQFILSQVALLEQVEALVPMLDSAHIKAVPEHAARLQRLAQIHIQQQDQCVEITEESKALLEEYNKTVSFLLSRVLSPFLFLALALPSHPNQPLYSPAPPPFRQVQKSLHSLFQTPVLTLTFNQTMLLSKQFVQWDELLCQLEAAKQVKPAEE